MLKFKEFSVSAILSLLIYGGLLSLIVLLITPGIPLLIPVGIGILVVLLNSVPFKKFQWLLPTICMGMIALCAGVLWERTFDGIAELFNEFIDAFKQVYAKNYDVFVVVEPKNLLITFALASALLALA